QLRHGDLRGARSGELARALCRGRGRTAARAGVFRACAGERCGSAMSCRASGYTGERGFEIIPPRAARDLVWTALAQQARPAGFAAADILRIEAGFLLFADRKSTRLNSSHQIIS